MNLYIPIEKISGIGPVYKKKLKKLGIKTIHDLFFHFPHRYEDFSKIIPISKVKLNEICSIQGKLLEIKNIRTRKFVLTNALIEDKTAAIRIVWFNQPYLTNTLKKGDYLCLSGKLSLGKTGAYLSNPSYEKIKDENMDLTHTGRIIPIYSETIGLSSRWLRYIIKPLLLQFKNEIKDPLPEEIKRKYKFPEITKALWQIHFPDSLKLAEQARKRFSFEELFLISLFVLRQRAKLSKEKAPVIPFKKELIQKLVKSLEFKLTNAQKKCSWQILKDLEKPQPMNRLLEGDVGSGKTIVAAIAALSTIKNGFQAAMMAPTEILAKQHFQEISRTFGEFKINIGLLTGKEDKFISKKLPNQVIEISRKKLLEKVKDKEIDILIGTHTLIQDKVKFGALGLVILDEQHRFGVKQRAKLCQKQELIPHLLSMTATPIPRTLALTVYGDLDLSLLDELPKGRKKIITKAVTQKERKKTYTFIKKEIKKGRQAFIICPKIEENKKENNSWANVKSVKQEYENLSKNIFPNLKIEMLHGKMTPKQKEKLMQDFKNKKIDILVSTSVIEVGVDVPGATIMIIEGAERFGLSQLHQFRGRVGRRKTQSYCFLFTDSLAQKTTRRMKALITSENSFQLAEKDLAIRGPGEFFGTRQWGIPDLAMESLKDISLIEKTRELAKEILIKDPQLKKYPLLQERLRKFRKRVHLE